MRALHSSLFLSRGACYVRPFSFLSTGTAQVALALLTQLLNVLNAFIPGGGSEHMDTVSFDFL